MHAKNGGERQEENPLAERAYGALSQRREERPPEVVPAMHLIAQPEPGEVVLLKPGCQAGPIYQERQQEWGSEVSGRDAAPEQAAAGRQKVLFHSLPGGSHSDIFSKGKASLEGTAYGEWQDVKLDHSSARLKIPGRLTVGQRPLEP